MYGLYLTSVKQEVVAQSSEIKARAQAAVNNPNLSSVSIPCEKIFRNTRREPANFERALMYSFRKYVRISGYVVYHNCWIFQTLYKSQVKELKDEIGEKIKKIEELKQELSILQEDRYDAVDKILKICQGKQFAFRF